ncbi:MAG: urease accessory protein UreF [Acetobacteraceae bacterium]|nr:urease accessory protein UreF [Acetobacteraceae bacterium]
MTVKGERSSPNHPYRDAYAVQPGHGGTAGQSLATVHKTTGVMRLLTWLSPAFPTGAFAYSHGLEWAVETHDIRDGETLREWLSAVIAHGSGRNDTILLRHAHRAARDPAALREIAALALAIASSRERRDEALAQGQAFVKAAFGWGVPDLPEDTPYAVAVGAMAGMHGIDEDATASAYLQTFTANLISAAVRLVPLGQTTGLQVLAALEPIIVGTAASTRDATTEDLGGCAFRSDLAAMRHETQYTRLFRS